jgi:hypothetical protein
VSVCPVRALAFGVRIHLGIDTPLTFLVLDELEISVVSFSHDEDCAGINERATEVAKAERAVEIDSAVEVATSEPATGAEKEYMSESFTRESGVKKRKTYRAGKKTVLCLAVGSRQEGSVSSESRACRTTMWLRK